MHTTTMNHLNGVPVQKLMETIEAVGADASLGDARFRARNRWISGALNRSSIQGFHAAGAEDDSRREPFIYDNDEPPVLLGENRGANPVEYLLHGLAGCITTTFVYYAAAMGVELESVESMLEGDLDLRGLLGVAPVKPGFQSIRVRMQVRSSAPEAKVREVMKIAQMRSPVFSTVSTPVPVRIDLEMPRG